MSEPEVLKYLSKKAPMLTWTIDDETTTKNGYTGTIYTKHIRGAFILNGVEVYAITPIKYVDIYLDDIAEGFINDYKRKTNASV